MLRRRSWAERERERERDVVSGEIREVDDEWLWCEFQNDLGVNQSN